MLLPHMLASIALLPVPGMSVAAEQAHPVQAICGCNGAYGDPLRRAVDEAFEGVDHLTVVVDAPHERCFGATPLFRA